MYLRAAGTSPLEHAPRPSLYLDLLKRVLVNQVYGAPAPPEAPDENSSGSSSSNGSDATGGGTMPSGGDNRDKGGHLGVPSKWHERLADSC